MNTQKRDMLASSAVMLVSNAIGDATTALHRLQEGKSEDAAKLIAKAIEQLPILMPICDEACAEIPSAP